MIVCLTEFSKNARFQKKSLQAIETLKSTTTKLLKTPECPLSAQPVQPIIVKAGRQTQEEQYWFPVLFAFHDVLMTGDDLEVRSRYECVESCAGIYACNRADILLGPSIIYSTR